MTEEKRKFLEEHRDFLRKIAMSVFGLVSTSDKKVYFRKQMKAFSHKVEEHQKELEEIKKDYDANSKLQEATKKLDEQIKNDPVNESGMSNMEMHFDCTDGWGMLENFKDYVYYVDGFWGRQTQKINLVHYLEHFPEYPPGDFEKTPNEEEKLICSYTLLTAIHDKYIKEKPIFFDKPDYIYQNSNPQHWIVKIEQRYDCSNAIFADYFNYAKDTQAWITRILSDVKYDIQIGTQPNFRNLSIRLWDLHDSFVSMCHIAGKSRYPVELPPYELDHYEAGEVLKKINELKIFAPKVYSQQQDPKIVQVLEILAKLYRDVERIHHSLMGPLCPYDNDTYAEAQELEKEYYDSLTLLYANEYPKLKEKYQDDLEKLAAKFQAEQGLLELKENYHGTSEDLVAKLEIKSRYETCQGDKAGGGKRGRPKKHTEDDLERMQKLYDEYHEGGEDSKAAWNRVGKLHKISGDAARTAVSRYQKSLNKKQK